MDGGFRDDSAGGCADLAGRPYRPAWKRWTILASGWFFVLLGIVGLVLPILQGFLFIAVGLLILSRESVWACRQLERLRARFPTLAEKGDDAQAYVVWLGERVGRLFRGPA